MAFLLLVHFAGHCNYADSQTSPTLIEGHVTEAMTSLSCFATPYVTLFCCTIRHTLLLHYTIRHTILLHYTSHYFATRYYTSHSFATQYVTLLLVWHSPSILLPRAYVCTLVLHGWRCGPCPLVWLWVLVHTHALQQGFLLTNACVLVFILIYIYIYIYKCIFTWEYMHFTWECMQFYLFAYAFLFRCACIQMITHTYTHGFSSTERKRKRKRKFTRYICLYEVHRSHNCPCAPGSW